MAASAVLLSAVGHGSVIMPPSRNAVDGLAGTPWSGGKHPDTGWIMPYSGYCNNGEMPKGTWRGGLCHALTRSYFALRV